MRAIILAAGRGNRMGNLTDHHPKAMLKLHGKPLIEWQMQAIRKAGIESISIVTGYKAEVFSYDVPYFNNPRWNKSNMLSTLICADQWLEADTCIISYSDIVYSSEAIQTLIDSSGDIAITYDPHWLQLWQRRFDDPLSDAEIFKYQNGQLIDIGGKTNNLDDIQGQYMGLLKFTRIGWMNITMLLASLSEDVIDKLDMTALLKLLLSKDHQINVVATKDPWCEIDNMSDYQLCHELLTNLNAPNDQTQMDLAQ